LEKLALKPKAPYSRLRQEPTQTAEAFCVSTGRLDGSGTVKTAYNGPYTVKSVTGEMADVVTPGYNQIVAAGGIVNNPCHKVHVEVLEEDGSYSWSCPGGMYADGPGPWTSFWLERKPCAYLLDKVDQAPLEKEVKLKAIAYIDKTPYAMGGDVFEIRETLRFLKRPLGSLLDLTAHIKRQRGSRITLRSNAKLAQHIADNWLTYRFAFSPLVQSASNVYESLFRKEEKLPPRLHSGGSASDGRYAEDVVQIGDNSDYVKYSRSCLDNVMHHATVYYEVTNPVTDWRRTYGLRWKDLPTTLWQIVPLSFLVDRLVNIQQGIQGLTNLLDPSVRILAASHATRENLFQTIQATERFRDNGCSQVLNGGIRSTEDTVYTRYPWTPSVGDIVPGFNPGGLVKDATSVVDLMALILQRLKV
jgi:hypothetical protein